MTSFFARTPVGKSRLRALYALVWPHVEYASVALTLSWAHVDRLDACWIRLLSKALRVRRLPGEANALFYIRSFREARDTALHLGLKLPGPHYASSLYRFAGHVAGFPVYGDKMFLWAAVCWRSLGWWLSLSKRERPSHFSSGPRLRWETDIFNCFCTHHRYNWLMALRAGNDPDQVRVLFEDRSSQFAALVCGQGRVLGRRIRRRLNGGHQSLGL